MHQGFSIIWEQEQIYHSAHEALLCKLQCSLQVDWDKQVLRQVWLWRVWVGAGKERGCRWGVGRGGRRGGGWLWPQRGTLPRSYWVLPSRKTPLQALMLSAHVACISGSFAPDVFQTSEDRMWAALFPSSWLSVHFYFPLANRPSKIAKPKAMGWCCSLVQIKLLSVKSVASKPNERSHSYVL